MERPRSQGADLEMGVNSYPALERAQLSIELDPESNSRPTVCQPLQVTSSLPGLASTSMEFGLKGIYISRGNAYFKNWDENSFEGGNCLCVGRHLDKLEQSCPIEIYYRPHMEFKNSQ